MSGHPSCRLDPTLADPRAQSYDILEVPKKSRSAVPPTRSVSRRRVGSTNGLRSSAESGVFEFCDGVSESEDVMGSLEVAFGKEREKAGRGVAFDH